MWPHETSPQDRDLAPEEAEGRRAGHHQRREEQQAARHRGPAERAPADLVEVGGTVELGEGPRGEERDRLRERVVRHVEQCSEHGRLAAQPEPNCHDPHVLDARVREEALEVPLDEDERCRDKDGGEPEAEEQPPRERRPEDGRGDEVHAQEGVERAVHHPHRHENAGRRRGLAIRVRLPGVHRGEARLGAVADEGEHHGQLHGEGVQLPGVGEEPRPVEGGHLLAEDALARGEQQHGTEQGEGESHAAEDEELPGGLQRRVPVLEGHEEDGGEGRRFHRDPEDPEVVGRGDEEHRRDVGRHEGHELRPLPRRHEARPLVALEVSHGVEARQEAHESGQDEDQGGEAVHAERSSESGRGVAGQEPPGGGEGQGEGRREAADESGLLGPPGAGQGTDAGGREGGGERREEEVHINPSGAKGGSCPSTRTGPRSGRRGHPGRARRG